MEQLLGLDIPVAGIVLGRRVAWDGENRLLSMETIGHQTGDPTAIWNSGVPLLHIDFKYDYKGRRISKMISTWNGSAFAETSETRFAYCYWNMVADYAVSGTPATLTLAHTYLWGTDLSGNLHGASGVGGLLAFGTASGLIELPVFDGNGNVMGLTDRISRQVTAAYEYSPFGDALRKVGSYASINPVRFSSKYTDDETKLIYYGHRYYNAALGRFIGRDPTGEKGGLHLFAFVNDCPIDLYDVLGDGPGDPSDGNLNGDDGYDFSNLVDSSNSDESSNGFTFGFGFFASTSTQAPASSQKGPPPHYLIEKANGFTITNIFVPNLKNGAAAELGVFGNFASTANGIIYQRLLISTNVQTPTGLATSIGTDPVLGNYGYSGFEAWQVENGQVGIQKPGQKFAPFSGPSDPRIGVLSDILGIPAWPTNLKSGIVTITVDIVFVPGSTTLPAGWNPGTNVAPSGVLWTTGQLNGWNSNYGDVRTLQMVYDPVTQSWTMTTTNDENYITPPPGYNPTPPVPAIPPQNSPQTVGDALSNELKEIRGRLLPKPHG